MADKLALSAVVVGGGPVGLTAAITLADAGVATVLIGKRPGKPDNRTTALLAGSVTALKAMTVWELCRSLAAPLRVIRIVDDTGRLWRAPELKFEASEIGLDAFGHNIENLHLIAALEQRARALADLRLIEDKVASVVPADDSVAVTLKGGETLTAQLVIGADGRNSLCRRAARIKITEHKYGQVALTLCFNHSRPHCDISTEFHTSSGPFTLVPLPGNRSSLVWVLEQADANEIAAINNAELSAKIERASHSILGKIAVEPGRSLFPLCRVTARRFADSRIALVGEAAHVIPPIGAQGLNLGLRDATTIGELATAARRHGNDIGGAAVFARYDRVRRADVARRTLAVDLLNRTLLSDFLAVQGARGLGLYMLQRIGPLRRALMREGLSPRAGEPQLMGEEIL